MYWTRKIFIPCIAIACLWIVANISLFLHDYSIIADRYRIDIPELEKAIGIITNIDETGQKQGSRPAGDEHEKENLFQGIYEESFVTDIYDSIKVETIRTVKEFIGDIQLRDIPENTDENPITSVISAAGTGSIAEFKNSKAYLALDYVDRFRALELFYRTQVLPNIAWEPEHTLSGVFAELSRDLTYSDAKNLFFNDAVIPEIRKAPALRKVADVIFGFDHSMTLYEACLNRYILVKFDNNNAMFIPYDVKPSTSVENITTYIYRLEKEEILDKIGYWSRYAFMPPVILLLIGTILMWARHVFHQEKANNTR